VHGAGYLIDFGALKYDNLIWKSLSSQNYSQDSVFLRYKEIPSFMARLFTRFKEPFQRSRSSGRTFDVAAVLVIVWNNWRNSQKSPICGSHNLLPPECEVPHPYFHWWLTAWSLRSDTGLGVLHAFKRIRKNFMNHLGLLFGMFGIKMYETLTLLCNCVGWNR
jgi:hypothetical protein